ncbi:MAG: prepilin-type N-terminal cleavage/methylation domain-containing protein [Candidatus Saccharimonadales bacterium]
MKKLNQQGVTLVEVIISITIISVLSLVLMNFMVNWLQQHLITQTRSALLTQAQDTLDQVTNDIRLASGADAQNRILDDNAPNAPTNRQSWRSGNAVLILATAAEDKNRNIIFSDPVQYISEKNNVIYFVNNATLYRRVLAASVADNRERTTCPLSAANNICSSDRKMAEYVTEFRVRYFNAENQEVQPEDARSVQLEIKLRKKAFGQTIESTDRTRMVFRNG